MSRPRFVSDRRTYNVFSAIPQSAGSNQISGTTYGVDDFTTVSMLVDLQATSGSPSTTSLNVKLQYSPDANGTRWFDLNAGAITALTSTGQQVVYDVALGTARLIRLNYTLAFTGGTSPQATFEVDVSLQQSSVNSAEFTGNVNIDSSVAVNNTTTNPVPVIAEGTYNSSLPTLTNGNSGPLQLDSTSRLITNNRALSSSTDSVTASLSAATSGGWTPSPQTALSNTAVNIKSTGAGQLGGWYLFNPNASTVYIQFFNSVASGVTVGTTGAAFVVPLPAGAASNINWGAGIAFSAAFSWAATTTATGGTAPSTALTGFALYA